MAGLRRILLLACGLALAALAGGCSGKTESATASAAPHVRDAALKDAPLPEYRRELLDLAFETAAAIPVNPHIKDRSRTQEAVVAACLELDQPVRASSYIERIDNWRRGSCYADLAAHAATRGHTGEARQYLLLAEQVASVTESQDWRTDNIKVKIARAHALLGQTQETGEFEDAPADSETGKSAGARALPGNADSFDQQMGTIDSLIATGNFDNVKNALSSCSELFHRYYDDADRRAQAEEKIRTSWSSLPVFIRIDLLKALAGAALDHSDQNKALEIVNEAQSLADSYEWPLEHRLSSYAELAGLRHRAGDAERARADADALRDLFANEGSKIVNIYRAGALRPLAQAYQVMGDKEAALSVYRQAVEEGVANPNSRPRAEDLSATCCSMALHGVEPDETLWARVREIRGGLNQPW